jgi:hypothetical protein
MQRRFAKTMSIGALIVSALFAGCSLGDGPAGTTTIVVTSTPAVAPTPTKLAQFMLGDDCIKVITYAELSQILQTQVTQFEGIAGNVSGHGFLGACNYETAQRQIAAMLLLNEGTDAAALANLQASYKDGTIAPIDGFGAGAFTVIQGNSSSGKSYRLVWLEDQRIILTVTLTGATPIADDATGLSIVKQIATIVQNRF